jgi:hypothetical protein
MEKCMLDAKVITCSVRRNARDLYEMLWRPESFVHWASGLGNASLERDDQGWTAQGPEGLVRITFTEHNDFGVMDHWVDPGGERIVYVPLRIIPNEEGSQVMLTLFRQPGMSAEKFAQDEAWVRRDFGTLKVFAEGAQQP